MSSADRFVALLVGIIAILSGLGAGLRLLWRISWQTGQLVTRLDLHLKDSGETKADYERRLRDLERQPRRRA